MATDTVLKPDHAAAQKHFIFTAEHEQLRKSIRRFVEKELRPPTPPSGSRRPSPTGSSIAWASSTCSASTSPEELGGQGGDYYTSLVLAEELARAESGGMAMGVAVHTDMAMPPMIAFGTPEQKAQWVTPAIRGEKILAIGITEPDAGSDVANISHAGDL